MARVAPDRAQQVHFASAQAIRDEIARAVPLYRGIEALRAKGDQIQWGGPQLYADGRFATPDGKAHFAVPAITTERTERAETDDSVSSVDSVVTLRVSTRRGKQFNSMIQRDVDPLTGAARDAIFISDVDLQRLNMNDGDRVTLASGSGTYSGRLRRAAIAPGNLEVHWPEGNVLLSATTIDPESMEPDYNARVTMTRSVT